MRIIGGTMRGRPLAAPKGTTTRPTTDRVRESLFSVLTSQLGPDLGGAAALDAFAGSGALGFEALSRGMSTVTFVERDRRARAALEANAASLQVGEAAVVVLGDVFSLASRGVLLGPYSLILLDPPYTLDPSAITALLVSLSDNGALEADCVVSWEHSSGVETVLPEGFTRLQTKRYGSTEVEFAIYERGAGAE